MNNSNALPLQPITAAARAAAIQHQRLLRTPDVADRNARQAQERAASFLAELRKSKGDPARVEPLIARVTEIVDAGAAALATYDNHISEVLIPAEANYREACTARDAADEAYARGSVDGEQAIQLFLERERALAAFRVRDRELTQAQRPARLPSVGLPNEAREAGHATNALASVAAQHGIDFDPNHWNWRTAADPVAMAIKDARTAELSTAIFWVAFEARILAEHAETVRRRRRMVDEDRDHLNDKKAVEDLRALFAFRWEEFSRVQSMSELERFRLRSEIR